MRWGLLATLLTLLAACTPLPPPFDQPAIPNGTATCPNETVSGGTGHSAEGRLCFRDAYRNCTPHSFTQTDLDTQESTVWWVEQGNGSCHVFRQTTDKGTRYDDCATLDFYTRTYEGKDMYDFFAVSKSCTLLGHKD